MRDELLKRYRHGGFSQVPGWGLNEELADLFMWFDEFHSLHGIRGPLCEIGAHYGRVVILLGLLAKPGERTIAIDLFEDDQDQNLDASGSGSYTELMTNIAQHAPGVEFDIVKANSFFLTPTDVAKLHGCRLMHIDGGHSTEVVLNDLALAQSIVGPGGVIVVDDYLHSGFPEVQEGVHRYFWNATALKAVPFMIGKNKIFLTSISHKHRLLPFIGERLPTTQRKPVRVLGYDAICCDPH
jgi:Methyltransferase domain